MPAKVPTHQDYEAYDGAHTDALWREVGDAWCCPICARSRFQILTWTHRQTGWDWLAPLCTQRDDYETPRFDAAIICQHCNRAGYNAQTRLGLDRKFRFSPDELRSFVSAQPHERATFDLERARAVVETLINPI